MRWSFRNLLLLIKTLNVPEPSYFGSTRSISLLLLPGLLVSPGHQQPWYCLCKIVKSWSYTRKNFNYLRHINVEAWHKMWIYIHGSSEKFTTYTVKSVCVLHHLWNSTYAIDYIKNALSLLKNAAITWLPHVINGCRLGSKFSWNRCLSAP